MKEKHVLDFGMEPTDLQLKKLMNEALREVQSKSTLAKSKFDALNRENLLIAEEFQKHCMQNG